MVKKEAERTRDTLRGVANRNTDSTATANLILLAG